MISEDGQTLKLHDSNGKTNRVPTIWLRDYAPALTPRIRNGV